jgi:phosphoribosylformimino-5-aminoimidazole carboxamide ribotide isomerase
MILYPAIDIYQGKCVRLEQGDFSKPRFYYDNPADAAKKWVDQGATWIHVVDLDGAIAGKPVNLKPIENIMTSVNVPIQVGGGIRNKESAEIFLTLGAGRVVLGSAIYENPEVVEALCQEHADRIGLGIDAKDGKVAIRGWKKETDQTALALAQKFERLNPSCVIYTDISRDGMLTGPNFKATEAMILGTKTPIIGSGGISSIDDLKKLKKIGCRGAIVGRSIYEGQVNLEKAILELC